VIRNNKPLDWDTMSTIIFQLSESLLARWRLNYITPKLLDDFRRSVLWVVSHMEEYSFVEITDLGLLSSLLLNQRQREVVGGVINAFYKDRE